jgi:hypothetical protein
MIKYHSAQYILEFSLFFAINLSMDLTEFKVVLIFSR